MLIFTLNPEIADAETKKNQAYVLLKGVYNSDEEFSGSIQAGNADYRIVLMRYMYDDTDKKVFSIYTPYAYSGRIRMSGLLREIRNPAAYKPVSPVYAETAAVKPDTALKKNAKTGYKLDAGSYFSLFGEKSETTASENYEYQGAYFSGRVKSVPGKLVINSVIAFSEEKDETEKEIWYTERAAGYGRKIRHTAFSSHYIYKKAVLGFASAVSEIENSPPGWFLRFSPALRLKQLGIYTLYAFTQDNFILPGGAYPSIQERKGFTVLYRPVKKSELKFSVIMDQHHQKNSDIIFRGLSETVSAGLSMEPLIFILKADFENSRTLRTDNYQEKNYYKAAFGIQFNNLRLVHEKTIVEEGGNIISDMNIVKGGIRAGSFDSYLYWKYKTSEDLEQKINNRIRYSKKDFSVYLEYSHESVNKKRELPAVVNNQITAGVSAKFK